MNSCHTPSVSQEAIYDVSDIPYIYFEKDMFNIILVFKASNAEMTNKMRGRDLYRSLAIMHVHPIKGQSEDVAAWLHFS